MIIADHPFHKEGIGPCLQQHPDLYKRFDGYETFNRTASLNIPGYKNANQKAQEEFPKAEKVNPALFAFKSTDGHSPAEAGLCYAVIEMPENYTQYRDAPERVVADLKKGYIASTFLDFPSETTPRTLGSY